MNERLRQFAKTMRSAPTDAEAALWYHLRAGRLLGHKFKRQQPIGDYIVYFVCFAQKLIVELDGGQHVEQAKADAQRTKWLESQGFRMLRFWNDQAFKERDAVLDAIIGALRAPHPLPNPSPIKGTGL